MSINKEDANESSALSLAKEFGYRNGYGQAKADVFRFITEAIETCFDARTASILGDCPENSKKEIGLRIEELRRVRAYVQSMKIPK